jgi:hypothetical protein
MPAPLARWSRLFDELKSKRLDGGVKACKMMGYPLMFLHLCVISSERDDAEPTTTLCDIEVGISFDGQGPARLAVAAQDLERCR